MDYSQMLGSMAGRFSPGSQRPQNYTGYSQNVNPFMTSVENTGMDPKVYAYNPENVYASQGAGASPSAGWGSRVAQQAGQDMGQMQRQQGLAQAATMRNTNTPGGMQAWTSNGPDSARWGQMMQGLQGMRQGMQRQGNRF